MKKIFTMILFMTLMMSLFACDDITLPITIPDTDYTTEINDLASVIDSELPDVITTDYQFPTYDDYDITYTLFDESYEESEVYAYPSLYEDIVGHIIYRITRDQTSLSFSKDTRVMAAISGEHASVLYLEMSEHVSSINKDTYFTISASLATNIHGTQQTVENELSGQIRGRGNSTWYLGDKKPYKLKFDEKISLLNMPASKDYTLIAEYSDKSFVRNVITHQMAKQMDHIEYVVETRYVDLYINQTYMGLYVLSEQVEIKKDKFDIDIDFETDPLAFFIEYDMRYYADDNPDTDPRQWTFYDGVAYNIKEPNFEDPLFTSDFNDAVADYLSEVGSILKNASYISDIESVIDIDNWIDYFIIQEISKDVDTGYSSIYMYKTKDSNQLKFGPLWDFDLAYGNADYIDYGPEGFYGLKWNKNYWYHLMMDIPEVRLRYQARVEEMTSTLRDVANTVILTVSDTLLVRANQNFELWDTLNEYVWPNPEEVVAANTFNKQLTYVQSYINQRLNWLLAAVKTNSFSNGRFNQIHV